MPVLDLIFVERKHDSNKIPGNDELLRRYEVYLNLFDAFLDELYMLSCPQRAENKVRLWTEFFYFKDRYLNCIGKNCFFFCFHLLLSICLLSYQFSTRKFMVIVDICYNFSRRTVLLAPHFPFSVIWWHHLIILYV